LFINYLDPKGISLIKEESKLNWAKDSTEVNYTADITDEVDRQKGNKIFDEAKAITLKQAYSLYNQNALFIDARDFVEFEIGHIKNAISLPYLDFDKYKAILDTIPDYIPLVTYCDGMDCDLSIMLGDKLFEMGYKEVYIFFGGWPDWLMAKYPADMEE
jgi:rhodanese-related sulfurtransferase